MAKETATIELIWDLMRGRTEGISRVDYFPQKPRFPDELPYEQPFPRAEPEAVGIPSGQMEAMLEALAASKKLHLHSVMVLRKGKVIAEAGFAPYRKEVWHTTYSMCKSVVSMAIGLLIDEGRLTLDTQIADVFWREFSLLGLLRQKEVTVRHLLTMTSGVSFNETGAVSGNNWVRSFLESPVHHEPGAFFAYNSMNTYMLSAIVTELTGETVAEYLTPRLFAPMGITRVFWESCPRGNNKGGWGLFLCVEDMAKLGQLYLDRGRWNGEQLIPEAWVLESVSPKVVPPEETGFPGYGYQIWSCSREGQFAFNGMLGQNVFVYPDMEMVVATTAGNEVMFNSNTLQEVLESYLPAEHAILWPLPRDERAYHSLLACEQRLASPAGEGARIRGRGWNRTGRRRAPARKTAAEGGRGTARWQKMAARLDGRRYRLETSQVGILPLMGQVFHNNYSEGISEIGFRLEKGRLVLALQEGDTLRALPVGFGRAEETELDFHGEPYLAAVTGRFAQDEDGNPVLAVEIAFLEDAIRRRMKLFFRDDGLEVRFGEAPGREIILDGLNSIAGSLMEWPLVRRVRNGGKVDLLRTVMESTIEPVVRGHLLGPGDGPSAMEAGPGPEPEPDLAVDEPELFDFGPDIQENEPESEDFVFWLT